MRQQPLLERDPEVRREFDYYPTPAWMTRALLRRVQVFNVLEPCAGDRAIADVLQQQLKTTVLTNDIDPSRATDFHLDMTQRESWALLCYPYTKRQIVWGVTNTPFNLADQIVPLAVEHLGCFATILRLSWLEPTAARQRFLSAHPPKRLIVLPRHDFKGRGATDSVTSAWFIWDDNQVARCGIDIVTKDERDELIAQDRQR